MKRQRLGEYVTFFISLAIVLGLSGILLRNLFKKEDSKFLTFEHKILWNEMKSENDSTILPVEIVNKGGKTATTLKVEVSDHEKSYEVDLEYIAGHSKKKFFMLFSRAPREDEIKVRLVYYSVD